MSSPSTPPTAPTEPRSSSIVFSIIVSGLALLVSILSALILLTESIPLGVPGEWIWPRIPASDRTLWGVMVASFFVGIYLVGWNLLASQIEKGPKQYWGGMLFLLLFSIVLPSQFRGIPASIYGTAGTGWVTYFPRMSGYYSAAVENDDTMSEYLAGYRELVAQGDYLHEGTHPPGLFIYFRSLQNLCETSPRLTDALLATQGESVQMGLDELERLSAGREHTLNKSGKAIIVLNLWLTLLAVGLTSIFLFQIVNLEGTKSAAWFLAGLWPLVPALAVFHPKSDLLLPLFATGTSFCWLAALKYRSWIAGLLSGIILCLGCTISLALVVVPVIFVAALGLKIIVSVWQSKVSAEEVTTPGKLTKQVLPYIAYAAVGFSIPIILLSIIWQVHLWEIWPVNLANHAKFYDHNVRTYASWLAVNVSELCLAIGPAVFVVILSGLLIFRTASQNAPQSLWSLAVVSVWGVLWLSGKNMGEAGRLWIFLMPLLISSAGQVAERLTASESQTEALSLMRAPVILLLMQAVLAMITASVIDAFDFSAFL